MNQTILVMMMMFSVLYCSATSCDKSNDNIRTENNTENNNNDNNMANTKINIKVGSKTFTATLLDNNAAKVFKEMLPMTISMTELNGDEKYHDLPKNLPTKSANPGTTKKGDLMLFGSRTLVLFYKTRSTSYSYTKLGVVDDVTGLAEALGSGNARVTFEKK